MKWRGKEIPVEKSHNSYKGSGFWCPSKWRNQQHVTISKGLWPVTISLPSSLSFPHHQHAHTIAVPLSEIWGLRKSVPTINNRLHEDAWEGRVEISRELHALHGRNRLIQHVGSQTASPLHTCIKFSTSTSHVMYSRCQHKMVKEDDLCSRRIRHAQWLSLFQDGAR